MINQQEVQSTHTTPDPISIQRILKQMLDQQCRYCFMEVSSHAIHQQRIAGLKWKGGVFTNISHDHLDYHGTYMDYLNVKKFFFDNLPSGAFALTNTDDRNGKIMIQNTKAQVFTYGLKKMAGYKGKVIENHLDGMLLEINNHHVWTTLNGTFNAYNLIAVYAVSCILGMNEDTALQLMSSMKNVEGRFEHIHSENGIHAIIDYAHTPDALKNVLETICHIKKYADRKIISVVGAGGDKDREKRSEMGRIVAKYSHKVILTSDNPRNEEPENIIKDILKGVPAEKHPNVISITNRYEAIKTACMLAEPGDIILVAGKGHEQYQEIKGVKHPFNDKQVVSKALNINQRVC
jgi:UDP-N-acetylmuramoyl-L-alanyl-D-glutamate--2,6-diaminopimelate ligase